MRAGPIAAMCLALAGCAGPLPEPPADRAWVALAAQPSDLLMSDRLDGETTPDGRLFLVPPGRHRLEARYEYEVPGALWRFGDREFIRCTLVVDYAAFEAGARYRLVARSLGYQAQGWLEDAARRRLADAQAVHCY